jgi:hypothetical protein
MRQTLTSATAVAVNHGPAKIHSMSASPAIRAMVISWRDIVPILASSASAQRGTSSLYFTPGG